MARESRLRDRPSSKSDFASFAVWRHKASHVRVHRYAEIRARARIFRMRNFTRTIKTKRYFPAASVDPRATAAAGNPALKRKRKKGKKKQHTYPRTNIRETFPKRVPTIPAAKFFRTSSHPNYIFARLVGISRAVCRCYILSFFSILLSPLSVRESGVALYVQGTGGNYKNINRNLRIETSSVDGNVPF